MLVRCWGVEPLRRPSLFPLYINFFFSTFVAVIGGRNNSLGRSISIISLILTLYYLIINVVVEGRWWKGGDGGSGAGGDWPCGCGLYIQDFCVFCQLLAREARSNNILSVFTNRKEGRARQVTGHFPGINIFRFGKMAFARITPSTIRPGWLGLETPAPWAGHNLRCDRTPGRRNRAGCDRNCRAWMGNGLPAQAVPPVA